MNCLFQAKSIAMEAWKENTVIVIIVNVNMDSDKMVMEKVVRATKP